MVLLRRLPSVVCLLANTEVRYLPTMLILLVLTKYCSVFILGELIKSFAYSQTLLYFNTVFGSDRQLPCEIQLAIFLNHAGHYGNTATIQDIADWANISVGSIYNCTKRVKGWLFD
jgi:hypothetical protein